MARAILLTTLFSFLPLHSHASEEAALQKIAAGRTQLLSEETVLKLFRESSVAARQESAISAQTQLDSSLTDEAYQARAYSSFNLKRSKEEAPNIYQPVLSPYQDWNVGVEKRLPLGTKAGVEAFGTKYSFRDGPVNNATQVGLRATAELDLWKNIFGALDRAQLQSAGARAQRSKIEMNLNLKRQELRVRKAFWSFVAASRSIDLSEQLVKTAQLQLRDVRGRAREGAADKGEVARYQSQLESRNTSKLLFLYEREVVMQAFEQDFKSFQSSQWVVDNPSLVQKEQQISACLDTIAGHLTPNLDYTAYDEIIGLVRAETDSELKVAKKHSDIDVALVGQYQTTGVDTSYDRARQEIQDEARGGYLVGLKVSVPIGGAKKQSETLLLRAKKDSLEAKAESLSNDLRSQHETMLKAILYLRLGLKGQVENTRNLTINYQEMQRKYRQGRIPVSTLILEQDSLFQSQLNEINLRKQITHVVLDYFSVFNEFPCAWNKI